MTIWDLVEKETKAKIPYNVPALRAPECKTGGRKPAVPLLSLPSASSLFQEVEGEV